MPILSFASNTLCRPAGFALAMGAAVSLSVVAWHESALAAAPVASSQTAQATEDDAIEEISDVREVTGPALWWGEGYPTVDRAINVHLATVTRRRALRLIIDHRTNQPVRENTFHDYFGFDAGSLKIGLALRYGLIDDLDVGVMRLSNGTERFDVYEFDAKYRILRGERHGIDVALRAGFSWFAQSGGQASGFLGQVLASRRFRDRLTLGTALLFHSNSTNAIKSNVDDRASLAAAALFDVRFLRWLSWSGEIAVNLVGYGWKHIVDRAVYPSISSSARFCTNRHTFALVVSNNPYSSADGYVANSPLGFRDVIVGFTITREWNL